jgi:hypothetical protein
MSWVRRQISGFFFYCAVYYCSRFFLTTFIVRPWRWHQRHETSDDAPRGLSIIPMQWIRGIKQWRTRHAQQQVQVSATTNNIDVSGSKMYGTMKKPMVRGGMMPTQMLEIFLRGLLSSNRSCFYGGCRVCVCVLGVGITICIWNILSWGGSLFVVSSVRNSSTHPLIHSFVDSSHPSLQ